MHYTQAESSHSIAAPKTPDSHLSHMHAPTLTKSTACLVAPVCRVAAPLFATARHWRCADCVSTHTQAEAIPAGDTTPAIPREALWLTGAANPEDGALFRQVAPLIDCADKGAQGIGGKSPDELNALER